MKHAFLWASNACLILDVVFSALCVVGGHEEPVVSLDLAAKVALLLFVTSLPFFALDRELAASRSELTFVWKIWTIEAVDFCTILYGAIDYAAAERRRNAVLGVAPPPGLFDPWGGLWAAPWRAWSPALRVYVAAFAANAVLFGGLASGLLARALTAREDEHVVGRAGYMFVATYVFALDAVTDLPVWFASLVTRAYVHNLYLTFNVVINLLALVRGIYICLVACLLPLGPPPRLLGPDADPALYGATRAASTESLSRLERATSSSLSELEADRPPPPPLV